MTFYKRLYHTYIFRFSITCTGMYAVNILHFFLFHRWENANDISQCRAGAGLAFCFCPSTKLQPPQQHAVCQLQCYWQYHYNKQQTTATQPQNDWQPQIASHELKNIKLTKPVSPSMPVLLLIESMSLARDYGNVYEGYWFSWQRCL